MSTKNTDDDNFMSMTDFTDLLGDNTPEVKDTGEVDPIESIASLMETGDKLDDETFKETSDEGEETPDEVKLEQSADSANYLATLKTAMKSGLISEFSAIEVGEDIVPLEELELTEDMFNQILQTDKLNKESAYQANHINKENLSDVGKQLLEIDMQGGDITQLLQVHQEVVAPLEGMDLDKNPSDQKIAIAMKYQLEQYNEKDIVRLVNSLNTKELKEEAKLAKEFIGDVYQAQLFREKETLAMQQQQMEEYRVKNIHSVQTSLTDWGVDKRFSRKLVSHLESNTPDGDGLDTLYLDARANPEFAHKLLLFLANPEEYDKKVSAGATNAVTQSTFKLLQNTGTTKGTNTGSKRKNSGRDTTTNDILRLLQ